MGRWCPRAVAGRLAWARAVDIGRPARECCADIAAACPLRGARPRPSRLDTGRSHGPCCVLNGHLTGTGIRSHPPTESRAPWSQPSCTYQKVSSRMQSS